MTKLLGKLLLLLLVAIINYPSASTSPTVYEKACGVSNHCIGWNYCGWTLYGYRKSCCVNQRCQCKESIYDSTYCENFEVKTAKDFENLCSCFPDGCYYKDDTEKMVVKCVKFINRNYANRHDYISNDYKWWIKQLSKYPIGSV